MTIVPGPASLIETMVCSVAFVPCQGVRIRTTPFRSPSYKRPEERAARGWPSRAATAGTPPTFAGAASRVRSVGVIDELIANNVAFANALSTQHLDVRPSRRLAIVTCMDSRLDVFAALRLRDGEA